MPSGRGDPPAQRVRKPPSRWRRKATPPTGAKWHRQDWSDYTSIRRPAEHDNLIGKF